MQQLVAVAEGLHLQLGAEGVAVVHQAREDVLVQVVLQLLQHALDAAPDGLARSGTLQKLQLVLIPARGDRERGFGVKCGDRGRG